MGKGGWELPVGKTGIDDQCRRAWSLLTLSTHPRAVSPVGWWDGVGKGEAGTWKSRFAPLCIDRGLRDKGAALLQLRLGKKSQGRTVIGPP